MCLSNIPHMLWPQCKNNLAYLLKDYARHREEREAANCAWESTETMLHNKINTLDATLETAKNEITYAFVNGFKGAVEQIAVVQPT